MTMRPHLRSSAACRSLVSALVPLTLGVMLATTAGAQSNLSTQGFGYPTGQLSARAQGTGGAIGEMDPLSPLNPASIAALGSRLLFFQIEPEYRTVTTSAGSERTTTARYPDVFGALPVGKGVVMSFGASTLLDRTATTSFNTTQFLSPLDSVPMKTTYRVDGAMDDLRLAAGWGGLSWLRLGVAAHAITGHNLVSVTQAFADTVTFSPFTQTRVLSFSGVGGSAGFQILTHNLVASASMRHGGTLNLSAGDSVLSSAKVPNRYGFSLAFTGIPNSAIAVRASHDGWASLSSLGTAGLVGVDAWDKSIGADVAGPHIGDQLLFVRAGFRDRTLPFEASNQQVTEKSISGGLGTAFAGGRVLTDVALIHASRTAGSIGATEHAWTVSIGLSILP